MSISMLKTTPQILGPNPESLDWRVSSSTCLLVGQECRHFLDAYKLLFTYRHTAARKALPWQDLRKARDLISCAIPVRPAQLCSSLHILCFPLPQPCSCKRWQDDLHEHELCSISFSFRLRCSNGGLHGQMLFAAMV